MNLNKEGYDASQDALAFALKYVDNPVHQRNMVQAVWHARGYTLVGGIPIPIGTNVQFRMGDDSWKDEWTKKYLDEVDALYADENNLEQEKQNEALSRSADEEGA